MYRVLLICVLMTFVSCGPSTWVLLVSGEEEFEYYHHVSGICAVYHALRNMNVPAEKILTFSRGTLVDDPINPWVGKIFFEPDPASVDLWSGFILDYNASNGNWTTLEDALLGDAPAGTRQWYSTDEDNAFVYFIGRGANDVFLLPFGDSITDDMFAELFHEMHFYYERINNTVAYLTFTGAGKFGNTADVHGASHIYVVANGNLTHDSINRMKCNEFVNRTKVMTCLSDTMTDAWIRHVSSSADETFDHQFHFIHNGMVPLVPYRYGNMHLSTNHIQSYLSSGVSYRSPLQTQTTSPSASTFEPDSVEGILIENEAKSFKTPTLKDVSKQEVMSFFDMLITLNTDPKDAKKMYQRRPWGNDNMQCYDKSVKAIRKFVPMNKYTRSLTYIVANLCEYVQGKPLVVALF